jgi:hypothetical protein
LRKSTMGIVMSARRSAWNNSAPTGRIFHEILCLSNFRKTVQKIQVSLKSDKNNGYFAREMFQTKVAEEIKIHTFCSVTFFFRNLYRLRYNVEK